MAFAAFSWELEAARVRGEQGFKPYLPHLSWLGQLLADSPLSWQLIVVVPRPPLTHVLGFGLLGPGIGSFRVGWGDRR